MHISRRFQSLLSEVISLARYWHFNVRVLASNIFVKVSIGKPQKGEIYKKNCMMMFKVSISFWRCILYVNKY